MRVGRVLLGRRICCVEAGPRSRRCGALWRTLRGVAQAALHHYALPRAPSYTTAGGGWLARPASTCTRRHRHRRWVTQHGACCLLSLCTAAHTGTHALASRCMRAERGRTAPVGCDGDGCRASTGRWSTVRARSGSSVCVRNAPNVSRERVVCIARAFVCVHALARVPTVRAVDVSSLEETPPHGRRHRASGPRTGGVCERHNRRVAVDRACVASTRNDPA